MYYILYKNGLKKELLGENIESKIESIKAEILDTDKNVSNIVSEKEMENTFYCSLDKVWKHNFNPIQNS